MAASVGMWLLALLVCGFALMMSANGEFLYFKPGVEYHYKFESSAKVKGLDTFNLNGRVAYSTIREQATSQEVHLRVVHLSMGSKMAGSGVNALEGWDFSRWFSFNLTRRGEIPQVTYDPADDPETLAFKKGFAALLASKLHGEHDTDVVRPTKDGWTYDVTEMGHEGLHNATYRVKRNADGLHVFTKTRQGHPLEHAKANYTKTITYKHNTGIVHSVRVKEEINAMGKAPSGFDPKASLGTSHVDGQFKDINMPEMRALAYGHLEFLFQEPAPAVDKPTSGLKVGSIHIDDTLSPRTSKVSVADLHECIKGNLTCMRWQPAKGSPKLTSCFRGLSTALELLPEDEMLKLASDYLDPVLTIYKRDREAILDAMSTVNIDAVQKRMVDLILLHSTPEVDMIHRYLIHIAGRKEAPSPPVLQALKSMVFQPERHPVIMASTPTYHRALLALGGVAKTLADTGMEEEAMGISDAVRDMLGVHDPYSYRVRRASLDNGQAMAEDLEKVILLETLGNMFSDSCFEVIVSHVNDTNSPWVKRAALNALRGFHHEEVADAILMRAIDDEDETVRYEAMRHYSLHPKADPKIIAMLSESHSAQGESATVGGERQSLAARHHRKRRSAGETVQEYDVKSPSVDWTKVVGSKDIGASFGANKKNELEFKTDQLTSEMTMDIADEVFARVNLGFMNANVDILSARVCFRGKAEYDINLLKEYDPTEMARQTQLFDSLKQNVSDSIVQSLARFRTIIDSSSQLGTIIKAYADAIDGLPDKVLNIGSSALTALETLGELDIEEMPAFIGPLWRLANKIMNLYNDIKNDVMGFYMKLLDTTVVIPYGSKQVFTAVSDIINFMNDFNDDPKSAMAVVSANTVLIGTQINTMLDALQEAREKAFFNRKIKPYWWNLKQEKDELNQMATEATDALSQEGATWVSSVIFDDLTGFSDGRITLTQLRQQVVNSLSNIPSDLITPFADVSDLGDDLQKAYTDAIDILEDMKNAYEDLRIGVKAAQEMVNRVFGPKVHRNFPRDVRNAAGNCNGNGMYQSSFNHIQGLTEYRRKGIDLMVNLGDTIVAPFAGIAMRNQTAPKEVILVVNDGLLNDIQMYIENVNPDSSIMYPDDPDYLPKFVAAGDTLGTASRSFCIQHIHVSMEKERRAYIDPTPYLQPRAASPPTWTQECDDYKFVYKGVTVAAGFLVGSPGQLTNNTSPFRTGSAINNPSSISSSYNPSVQVDQDITNSANLGYQLKSAISNAAVAAATSRDDALNKLVNKPRLFVGNNNLKDLKVGSLATFLTTLGHQSSLNRLNSVFQGIQTLMDHRPCLNPYQMADDKLREELRIQGKNSTGTRPELVDRFKAREDNCMSFSLGLPEDMYCKVDPQCMGVECCLSVKLFMYVKNYKFYTRYDPCSIELIVGIDQLYEYSIGQNLDMDDIFGGFSDLTLNTGILDSNLNAELILKMSLEKSDTQITISASAGFCRSGDQMGINCLVFIPILDRAVMPLPVCGPPPLRKLTFRTVNLRAELRNQREKFSENSKATLTQEVGTVVSDLMAAVPCLSSDTNRVSALPCPRPDKMTEANLIDALSQRGLSTTGSKSDLIARLEDSDRTCQEGNYSIPVISNATLEEKVYLKISDDCLLLEACVDFTYQNFPASVHSSMRLDECSPSLTAAFEDCSQEMALFSTNLNTTGQLKLSDNFIVDFKVQQDLPVNEYIFDLSLKVHVNTSGQPEVNDAVVENFRVPIPICNSTNYVLPNATTSFSQLANTFTGYLSTDMVAYLFRMLHLDSVFTASCSALPANPVCANPINVTNYMPQDYINKVQCVMDADCQGIVCCMTYNFSNLPLVNTAEVKNMDFEFKFDPCDNMKVRVAFGNFFQQEQLLDYEFGTEKTISIGVGEDAQASAPVIIRYKVKRLFQSDPYEEAFLVDASISLGISLDGTTYDYPSGGLTLMQNERIDICPSANSTDLAAFDLDSFASNLGENASTQLNTGTVQMVINEFGLTPQLRRTQCNIAKSPYVPNLRGWRDDCDSSLFNLPTSLGANTVCHMSSSCTRVDCCFYSPILDMSFNAFFDLNVCNYYIQGGIENKVYPIRYLLNETSLDWTNGVTGVFEISNAIRLEYNVKKTSVNFIVDLFFKLCLGNQCQDEVSIYHDTRVPQMDCLTTSTQSLTDVSFQFWKFGDCQLPVASGGCAIALPANYSQSCVLTNNCKTVHCCQPADLVVAAKDLEFTFTSDVCSDSFTFTLEEKSWTRSISGIPGISSQMVSIVESVGDAINLTLGVQSGATGLTISAQLDICTTTNSVTSCLTHALLSSVQIYDPASSCGVGRRKRSVSVDMTATRDAQMLSLINDFATTSEIELFFEQLEQVEADRCSRMKTGASTSAPEMNPKAILESMGDRNPSSIIHCNDSSILSANIEGATEIFAQLNGTTDIAGRRSQLYVPGKGLTVRGVNTLAHKIANMTLGELTAYVMAQDTMQPELVVELLEDMRQLLFSLYSDAITTITGGGVSDQFTSSDLAFGGSFSQPSTNEVFLRTGKLFTVGGLIPMNFRFATQITYGLDIDLSALAMHRQVAVTMTPSVSLQASGSLSVGVAIKGSLDLTGTICDVKFPSVSEATFSHFPIDVDVSLDLELIPLELKLVAQVWVDISLYAETVTKSLFKSNLWYYRTPSIRKRVLDMERKQEDLTAPQFITVEDSIVGPTNITTVKSCQVRQVPGLDYTDPRIEVIVDAFDDCSKVKLTLDIGTSLGLSDVKQGYEMGGPHVVITESLSPTGVPFYFRVTAANTEGVSSFVTCTIPTYDVTLPNGRFVSEFKSSSNSHILKASAVIYEDSALVSSRLAVGLGRNIYSDGVQGYQDVNFTSISIPSYDANSDPLGENALEHHFTGQKIGRLVVASAFVLANLQNVSSPGLCAKECMSHLATKCMSFNYDSNGDCQLLEAIETEANTLSLDGLHRHYERLAFGLASEFSFPIELTHNTLYYMVLHLTNSLGFENLLSTEGTLVDLTPPDPGPINIQSDVYSITDCESNLPEDRRDDWKIWCIGIDPTFNNHRTIIDDPGSMTIFNGHEPLVDLLYTKDNTYISANWDGIHDYESGLLGFSFAVGTTICGQEVKEYHDPYKHLLPIDDDSQWTGIGVVELPEGKKLPDGRYYVTVRAINQVEYGGPLVTTICHSTPLAIDNSPPIVYEIYNIVYDDVTYDLMADFNATDPESGIQSVYMCLGLNAINCDILGWTQTPSLSEIRVNFRIPDGQRAWIRLRVTNNVDLRTDAVASYPLVVDNGGPNAGTVYDGSVVGQDLVYSYVDNQFCANWYNFYDAESGIAMYLGAVVDSSGTLISSEAEMANSVESTCVSLPSGTLQHNQLYKYRLTAVNAGHKQLNTTVESNGVTIDTSNPTAGQVVDGQQGGFTDQVYSVSTSTVSAQWQNFADAESNIASYAVKVTKQGNLGSGSPVTVQEFDSLDNYTSTVEYNHLQLQHRDVVTTTVKAINGATATVEAQTNGIIIDLTPPEMTNLHDGTSPSDIKYTSSQGTLSAKFQFSDAESGIERFKFQVYETYQGSRHQHYPGGNSWSEDTTSSLTTKTLTGFSMSGGAHYSIRVAAVNNAGAVATYDTDGVIFDNTSPTVSAMKVGAFGSESQVLVGGYAQQADTSGIKASWTAYDHESGILYFEVAVGTSQYGTNVLSWRNVGTVTDLYIDGLSLSTTNTGTNTPVYYVTVRATNGASQVSSQRTSSPVKVLQENMAGTVTDGPLNTDDLSLVGIADIDFQKDKTTVTAQFRGFASYLHGIVRFDWAVGTTPGGEEVQPFMIAGLMHDETESGVPGDGIATRGVAHAAIPLQEGVTYYSTVRGITNDGTVLQSTSDGFTVDNTPPVVDFVSYAQEGPSGSLSEGDTLYRQDLDTLSAEWQFSDGLSHVTNLAYKMGSFPRGEDLVSPTDLTSADLLIGDAAMPGNQITPVDDGRANILTVTVMDVVGLSKTVVSPSVVIDKTAPTQGALTCPAYIQSHNPIECVWEGFHDAESPITGFDFEITVGESLNSIHSASLASTVTSYITPSLHGTVKHGYTYFAIVTATNELGMTSSVTSDPIRIDSTPPVAGTVVEVSNDYHMYYNDSDTTDAANVFVCNSTANCTAIDTTCQESLTSVYVAWADFEDPETSIVAYQIALGTSAGGGQIRAFFNVPVSKNYYQIKDLSLNGYRQLFVSVKAFNGAGMATVATSNGVYLSYISQGITPPSPFSVWDQDSTDGDIDYQTSRTTITARWDVSGDPCPVLTYEWAIERVDGFRVQDFYDTNGQEYGLNDDLTLYGLETYYQLLRVTTAMNNFTYTLRSDGVTVVDQPLYPGYVYDGDVTGIDLQYQPFRNKVSANWEAFGEKNEVINSTIQVISGNAGVIRQDKPPNQEIVRYEVAVGTDRRFATTRDDIVAWTDLGLNTSVTFYDLDLTVETATYYFTVRAYSTANTMAEVTSNGFAVRTNAGVTGGTIIVGDFVNATTNLPLKWEGFQSDVEILIYYVALSSASVPVIDCDHVIEGGPMLDSDRLAIFDVVDRTNIGEDTYTDVTGLSLAQDTDYWVSVIAVDEAARCRIITKQIHIDITVPEEGNMKNGPYYDMSMSYTPYLRAVELHWVNYTDAESGLDTIQLELFKKMSCNTSEIRPDELVETVTIAGSYLTYKFLDLDLNASEPYYVIMTVYNRARLSITTTSPLIFLDPSTNTAGTVVDGTDLLADSAWAGSQSQVTASILYLPQSSETFCAPQSLLNTDASWQTLTSSVNNDHTGRILNLKVRDANVQRSSLNPEEITIKLAKDTSTDDMYTGAIYRDAELALGGTYEMDILAAPYSQAVTSVLFWDGPEDYVTHFDFTEPDTTAFCDCCDDAVPSANCESICGGCSTYRSNRLVAGKRKKRAVNQVRQLTAQQRQTIINSGNPNSIVAYSTTNPTQPACGMQLYKNVGSSGRIVLWATFGTEYSYEPRFEEFSLSYDPSAAYHHYSVQVYSVADEAAHPTWCMEVAIDNSPSEISLCGLPQLSGNTTLMMTLWNWKNFVPTVNPNSVFATLWDAQATFKNIIVPASSDNLCRYKVPFTGADDGVLSFEAGIGSDTSLDDIVPFSRVHDPCIPCQDDCNQHHCNTSCDASHLNTVTLTLNGLNLPLNYTDVNGVNKPRTYYFTVRAMLASGLNAVASSDGFSIDTSPPSFDTTAFKYLDTSHADEIRPAQTYIGSDSTIKCFWECQDPESDVVSYSWAIGTTIGGTEVQNLTSVGDVIEGTNANLTGILADGVTYYVTVTCTNGAGLTTTYNDASGITVALTPPDLSSVSLSTVSTSTISAYAVPSSTRKRYSQTWFELDFTVDPDPNVNEYYFKICSQNTECDDIFERTLVSNRQSGRLKIYNGRLYKDNQAMFELQQVKKTYNASLASAVNSNSFRMEPGRQIFPYIDGCTEAQCSTKSFGAILIANSYTQTATSVSGESISTSLAMGYFGKRKRSATAIDITTPSGMPPGASISRTSLSDSDMTTSYDSAASSNYVPIITSPSATFSDSTYLDRILYNRVSYSSSYDEAFLLTSLGDIEMPSPLLFNYPYTPGDTTNTWMLLHWNPSYQKWQLSHETCTSESDTYVEDSGSNTITIKVCNTRGNDTHNSTYTYFREDTQFILTNVLDAIPNSAPVLTSSTTNSMLEDSGTLEYQLEYSDTEGDMVTFAVDDSVTFTQMNAECNLLASGYLLFTPCDDCHGLYKKVITLEEDAIAGIPAMTSTYTLTITVNSVNDAPVAFAFMDGYDLLDSDPTVPVEVLLEERRVNTTDNTNYTFTFGAYDYDSDDVLQIFESLPSDGTLTMISESSTPPTCSDSGIPCNNMSLIHAVGSISWLYRTYNFVPNDDYWGIDPAQMYVMDTNSSLSSVVTMNFSIMARPCQNGGECMVSENVTTYTCENVNRAVSFETYYNCSCLSGFEGQYCELDVDECAASPCKYPYVCMDGANGYSCQCPSDNLECDGLEGWMIGVAVVAFLVLVGLALLTWYLYAVRSGRLVWGPLLSRGKSKKERLDVYKDNGKNYSFDVKNYMVEEQDEDGFNNAFDMMKSAPPSDMDYASRPSTAASLPPIPSVAASMAPAALAAAPVATSMTPRTQPNKPQPKAQPYAAQPKPDAQPKPEASLPQSQLPAEETITPPISRRGSYIPRTASAASLQKSNRMRRSSTSSWLNNLLNMSDVDAETPRSRPITPVEYPEEEEEEEGAINMDDSDDALFFG